MGRIGVLLLALALAHAVTLGALVRIRDAQVGETMMARRREQNAAVAQSPRYEQQQSTVTPVPGQSGVPAVSPALDHGGPYSTDR